MSKIISLEKFLSHIKEGSAIGIGGFDLHRKPLSLVLEISAHASLNNLSLFGISLALEADILIGSGKVKEIISSYTGLENFGQCYFFRESMEDGKVSSVEMSTYATILALQAGALGLEYLPTKTMLHSDMSQNNKLTKIVTSPFSGENFLAIKSYSPDIALIHAHEADAQGNLRIHGPPATKTDELLARASKITFASVEKVVDKIESPTISGLYVSHVVLSPGGSAPTSAYPEYDVDSGAMVHYGRSSKGRNLERCKEVIADAIERRRKS